MYVEVGNSLRLRNNVKYIFVSYILLQTAAKTINVAYNGIKTGCMLEKAATFPPAQHPPTLRLP